MIETKDEPMTIIILRYIYICIYIWIILKMFVCVFVTRLNCVVTVAIKSLKRMRNAIVVRSRNVPQIHVVMASHVN